jgi:hypothetical protein
MDEDIINSSSKINPKNSNYQNNSEDLDENLNTEEKLEDYLNELKKLDEIED